MFFGVTTLFAIVIVFVPTASDGGPVGPLGPLDELGPELLLHAPMASAAMLATPSANRNRPVLICMPNIRQQNGAGVTSL
jgi:hypothetical protein